MWVRRPVSATSRGALGLLYRLCGLLRVFIAVCGLSGRGEQGLLVAVASPVVAHGCRRPGFSTCSTPAPWFRLAGSGRTGFSRCGSWALEHRPARGVGTWGPCGMWDRPCLGVAPMAPALADGLLSTAPGGGS